MWNPGPQIDMSPRRLYRGDPKLKDFAFNVLSLSLLFRKVSMNEQFSLCDIVPEFTRRLVFGENLFLRVFESNALYFKSVRQPWWNSLFHRRMFTYQVFMETTHFSQSSIREHCPILYNMTNLWSMEIFINLCRFAEKIKKIGPWNTLYLH